MKLGLEKGVGKEKAGGQKKEGVRGRETLSESNGIRIPVDKSKHVQVSRYVDDCYACAWKEEGDRTWTAGRGEQSGEARRQVNAAEGRGEREERGREGKAEEARGREGMAEEARGRERKTERRTKNNQKKRRKKRHCSGSLTHDCCLPVEEVIANWASRALCRRVALKVLELSANPFQRHCADERCVLVLLYKAKETS